MKEKLKILEKTFDTERIKCGVSTVLLLPYIPLGCLIAALRFCLLVNFLMARTILRLFLDGNGIIMKNIILLFMIILGIHVKVHGKRLPSRTIICNKRSGIDSFIICFLLNVFAVDTCNLPTSIRPLLQLCSRDQRRAGKGPATVLFPEKYSTTGKHLTPFESCLQGSSPIQPAAITYWRPLPISISTTTSSTMRDVFWMFFNPVTIVTLFLSPDYIDNNSTESCSSAAMQMIAKLLDIPIIDITQKELTQYVDSLTPLPDHKISKPMLLMIKKVEEVMPHVPRNVIMADLKKTQSVDVTLANIFEGVVEFIPIKTRQPPQTKSGASQHYTQLSPFEKRKAELMKTARQRYKEKHGL